MGYGDALLAKLGSPAAVEAYWNAAQPHLQARYCHVSLGTKIKIERIGDFKHIKGKTITTNLLDPIPPIKGLKEDTIRDIGKADMIAYLGYDPKEEGMLGVTDGLLACKPGPVDFKFTITVWQPTAAGQGSVSIFQFLKPNFVCK